MINCKFGNMWSFAWVVYTNKGITIYKDEKENTALKEISHNDIVFNKASAEQCTRNNAFIATVPVSSLIMNKVDDDECDICENNNEYMYLIFSEDNDQVMNEWTQCVDEAESE